MRSISAIAILALAMPSTTLGFQISPASSRVLSTSLYSKPINNINEAIDRRSAIHQIGTAAAGVSLSSLLLSSDAALAAQDYDDEKKKRILITGSNSGIGLDAAQRIALRGHEVILACRTLEKAKQAADKIKTNIANDSLDAVDAIVKIKALKVIPVECNLADLASIDSFIKDWKQTQSGAMFDAVCYNAGIARNTEAKEILRTKQGFELTVGTNHLGHFYLNHVILPLIKENGRIVVTASGVHDPDSPGGAQGVPATIGDLSGFEKAVMTGDKRFDMVDGGQFNADKAYKDSKLCNVLFTRELQRRLDDRRSSVKVNCFNPGLIVGTGLFRDQNQIFTKVFDVAATNLLKVGETTHWGGGALEYMTLSSMVGGHGGLYYTSPPGSSKYGDEAFGREFRVSEVSKEAKLSDGGKAKLFWELSEKLVGV
ncbi:hypothetical protein ACHAW6_001564 [Cyclotella cf. meneghiniana]